MLTTIPRPRSSRQRWRFRLLAALLLAALAWPRLGASQVSAPSSRASGAPLTLEAAHAAARRLSADLAAAREAVQVARGRERQAAAVANQVVSYGTEQTSGGGQSNRQHITSFEQLLEIAGQRAARRDAARARREAEEARFALMEGDVSFEVTRAFTTALATARQSTLADQAAREFELALRVSTERLAAGDISGYAHRRLRLEAARYAVIRAEAALKRAAARRALAALLGVAVDSLPPLPDSLSPPPPARDEALTALVARAAQSHPEVSIAELEFAAAIADARLASRERVPMPSLSAGYKREESAGSASSFSGFVAGISIPLPLFDRRAGAIDAAGAESRRREAVTTSLRRRIGRDAADALDAYRVAQAQQARLAGELGAEARAALTAAQVAYAEGEITLVEWLDAVRAYRETEASFASLGAEVLIRRAALERAVGAPIIATPRN